MIKVYIILYFFCLPLIGFSQVDTLTEDDFVITNYTTDDGLPSNSVYNCIKDDNGYMWLATEGGLSRFDGKHFVNYGVKDGLLDNDVISISIIDENLLLSYLNGFEILRQKNNSSELKYLSKYNMNKWIVSVLNSKSEIIVYTIDSIFFVAKEKLQNNKFKMRKSILDINCKDWFSSLTFNSKHRLKKVFIVLFKVLRTQFGKLNMTLDQKK